MIVLSHTHHRSRSARYYPQITGISTYLPDDGATTQYVVRAREPVQLQSQPLLDNRTDHMRAGLATSQTLAGSRKSHPASYHETASKPFIGITSHSLEAVANSHAMTTANTKLRLKTIDIKAFLALGNGNESRWFNQKRLPHPCIALTLAPQSQATYFSGQPYPRLSQTYGTSRAKGSQHYRPQDRVLSMVNTYSTRSHIGTQRQSIHLGLATGNKGIGGSDDLPFTLTDVERGLR